MAVESGDARRFGLTRTVPAVHRCNSLFVAGGLDAYVTLVRMEHVGVDALLHHRRRQIDALGSEHLNQGLGNDAPAVVAAGRSSMTEEPGFVHVEGHIQADGLGHPEKKEAEERPGWPSTDHANPGSIH